MSILRGFLLLLAVMTAASMPVLAQTLSATGKAGSATSGGTAVPNLTGVWTHPSFPWFEPPASGPSPLVNLSRNSQGVSNYDQMVGDYKNPILQPWAAELVKRAGQISMTDTVPNPSNQCWPNFPFLYKLQTIQLIQQPDKIMIMYSGYNNEIRRVRLNEPHLSPLKPSWYGDSIGHYEGDTLVIDTVGVKIGKYSMIDFFGTPYTDKLHIVERYKLRSWDEVKDAVARGKKDNWWFQGDVWTRNQDKMFLQAHVTIEDEGAFTTPWTGTLSYAPMDDFAESICAENRMEYYHGENSKESEVPKAEKPDF